MSTVSYEVIGEHDAPEDFKNYVFKRLVDEKNLHLVAKQTTIDDLASRRSESDTVIEFDLLIRELHTNDDDFAIAGYIFQNGEQGSWIVIEVTDRVRFDILD